MDNNFNNGGFAPQQPMQGQPQGQPMQQQQPVQQMQMQQQQPVQQQPQPVAAGGNMFDAMYGGFNDVKSGGTGQYPKPGAYLFKIVEVVNGQTSDGKMLFAAELEVISSTVPEHGPGTRLSSLVLFKNQNHLSTYQRQIKSFLHAAIAGVDPNTQFQNITPEVAMWATGGDQPLAGRYIRGQFALAMSKNNRQYTKESWAAWSGPGADPGPAFDSTTLEPVQMQEAAPVMMQQAPVQPQQGFQPQAQQGFAPQPQPQAQQGFQPQPQPQPQVQQGFAPQQQPQPQVQQGFAPQQQPQVQPGFAPQPQPQPQAQPGFAPQQPQQQPLQQPNMAQPQFGGGFTPQQ